MASKKRAVTPAELVDIKKRLRTVEKVSHEPFDFEWLIRKLERLENEVSDLKRFGSRERRGTRRS